MRDLPLHPATLAVHVGAEPDETGALAPLEGGEAALAFASGMAAMTAAFESLPNGSRVLVPDDCYSGLRYLVREFLPERGIDVVAIDMADLAAVERAFAQPVALAWV